MQCLPHLTHEGFSKQWTEKRHLYRAPFQNRSLRDPHVSGALKAERVSEGRPTRVFSRYFLKFLFLSWVRRTQVFFFSSGIFEGLITPNKAKGGFSVLPVSCLYRHGIWTGLTSCCPWIASSVLHRFRFLPSLVSGWWSSDSEESRLPSTRWSWHSAEMFHKRSKCCLCFRVQLRMKSLPPIKRHQRPPEVPFIRDHGVDEDQG